MLSHKIWFLHLSGSLFYLFLFLTPSRGVPNVWHFPYFMGATSTNFLIIKLQPKIYDHIMLTIRISFLPKPKGHCIETATYYRHFLWFFLLSYVHVREEDWTNTQEEPLPLRGDPSRERRKKSTGSILSIEDKKKSDGEERKFPITLLDKIITVRIDYEFEVMRTKSHRDVRSSITSSPLRQSVNGGTGSVVGITFEWGRNSS
uniref:Uncharacterized protein n=1 Tax=Solanum lycopersicum TaxID=4081 RepID=A0A3Q7GHL7_SOLLC